jgi:hypothetical protein
VTASPAWRGALGLLLGVALCGCGKEKAERDKVLAAIDRLQEAPARDYAGRKARAAELLDLKLETEPAVRARDACGSAYKKLAESNEMSEAIQKELEDTSKKSDPADLVRRLEASEALLAEAEPLLEACRLARGDLVASIGR